MNEGADGDPTDVNAVLLLGAGASCPFDYPTTDRFLKQIEKKNDEELAVSPMEFRKLVGASTIDEMVGELLDVIPNLSDGVASHNFLREAVGAVDWPGRGEKLLAEWDQFRENCEALLDIIVAEIYDTYSWHNDITSKLRHLEFYVDKVAELNGGHTPVFTTNYDVVVESLSLGDYEVNTLFEGNGPRLRRGELRTWQGRDALSTGERTINCFKLHGSVDWVWQDGHLASSGTFHPNLEPRSRNRGEIILPGAQVGTERISEPYITYFNLFDEHLSSCDLCVVVGHKLEDDEILEVLQNHDPSLIVVNPDESVTDKLDAFTDTWHIDVQMQTSRARSRINQIVHDFYLRGPSA